MYSLFGPSARWPRWPQLNTSYHTWWEAERSMRWIERKRKSFGEIGRRLRRRIFSARLMLASSCWMRVMELSVSMSNRQWMLEGIPIHYHPNTRQQRMRVNVSSLVAILFRLDHTLVET